MPSIARFSKDPVAAPSQPARPPKGTANNPALCNQCNASLHLDDSFLEPRLKTSATGEPYLRGVDPLIDDTSSPHQILGGIGYVRYDQIPYLPDLALGFERCTFCTVLREELLIKYQRSPWWKPHPEPLTMRFQYRWTVGMEVTEVDAVVVSIFHPELGEWKDQVLQFWVNTAGDENPCSKWLLLRKRLDLRKRLGDDSWSPHNVTMCRKWITECIERPGLCRDEPIDACVPASRSDDNSDAWCSVFHDSDSDSEVEANATAGEGHTQMSQSAESTGSTFLPTRLLDLFPVRSHTPDSIRLVESIHLEKSVRYAALSYCWGTAKPTVITTRANLDSHQQSIEFSALPQCLRDAVTVARSLEIQYLWIDALCIIQSDGDDWARESATMWQLFQNAYVTIAAAMSASFDEGFLTRGPFEVVNMNFASALNPQAVGKFTLSTISNPEQWVMSQYPLSYDLATCKWDKRGWVWQEEKLSKRKLIFGNNMIHFLCDHGIHSENESHAYFTWTPREGDRGSWTTWLGDYTQRQFTFVQDKLPAISGLSKQIDQNSITRGGGSAQYLAGIWYCSKRRRPQKGSGWQHQLFWTLREPGQSFQEMLERLMDTEPRTYTAPSWSWASRDEAVSWDTNWRFRGKIGVCPSRFEAKIEDHQMNLTGPDPTGRVGPGSYLKLSGLLHRDTLNLSWFEGLRNPVDPERIPGSYILKNFIQTPMAPLDLYLDWNHSSPDQEDPLPECDFRLFGLWRSRSIRSDILHGLLLLRDSFSGLYLRVGSFRMLYKLRGPDRGWTQSEWQSHCERWKRSKWQRYERWERQSVYIL